MPVELCDHGWPLNSSCPECEVRYLQRALAAKEKELGEAKQMLKECHLYIIGGIIPAREAGEEESNA